MARITSKINGLYCAGALVAFLGPAAAQSILPGEMRAQTVPYVPPSMITVRAQVNLVEVPVVVRDSRRRAVAGLTQEDFELYDAGRKQAITAFSVQNFAPAADPGSGKNRAVTAAAAAPAEATRPRFVALLFDNLNTGAAALKPAKDAAVRFVQNSLAPGDRVAVVTTATMAGESEFTGDVPKLVAQITKVTVQQRFSDEGAMECPHIRPYEAYLIDNHMDSAVLQAKVAELLACGGRVPRPELTVASMARMIWEHALFNSRNTLLAVEALVGGMAKLPGQRMILLTSAGFYTGNLESDEDLLMTKALHAEVVINTLDAKGLYTVIPGGDASEPRTGRVPPRAQIVNMQTQAREPEATNDGMAVLALGTGGTFYHNNNDLADGFRKLGMVPETIYMLGFTPSDVAAGGRYHTLKVHLAKGHGYSLQTRLGYMAPSAQAATQAAAVTRLDTEVMASDTIGDLPAGFSWTQRDATGITLVIHLDINRLHLEKSQNRWIKKLTIVAALMDSQGAFVTGKRSELELDFTEATLARLANTGANVAVALLAPQGNYSARVVVQDSAEGKLSAAGAAVQVK